MSSDFKDINMINLSFAGCGFLGIYHVGVASCFAEYAPQVLVSKIAGASVGTIAAAALICKVSLGQATTDILDVAVQARSANFGLTKPMFSLNRILRDKLEKALPPNAHEMCSGRLFISVTRSQGKKNELLSQFDTREELIQALLCSCYIPVYSGFEYPSFKGVKYIDGGLSNNLPVLDEHTVTVSPFAGEHDVCPSDDNCNILQINLVNTSIAISRNNLYRFMKVLFPPSPEVLSKMCHQGFDDALKYLQRKTAMSCTKCIVYKSEIRVCDDQVNSNHDPGVGHIVDDCQECIRKRRMASASSLPEAVVAAIQEACDKVNKGVINWLLKRKPLNYLQFLGIPYIYPINLSIAIFRHIWEKLPDFRYLLEKKMNDIVNLIKQLISKVETGKTLHRAMFKCDISVTEYNYQEDQVDHNSANAVQNGNARARTEKLQVPKRKSSIMPTTTTEIITESDLRQQRKSYAGFPNNSPQPDVQPARRKSVSEINQPERVIRNMKFGFTVGVMPNLSPSNKNTELFQSLKSLGEDDSEVNLVELAKRAMCVEREYLEQHSSDLDQEPGGSSICSALKVSSEPVMRYSYMSDKKTIKINEIYNVTDADTSFVLSDEERQVNSELQWESDWVNPVEYQQPSNVCVVDTLDDYEFDMSDSEFDLTGNDDTGNSEFDLTGNNKIVERIAVETTITLETVADNFMGPLTEPPRKPSFSFSDPGTKPPRKSSFSVFDPCAKPPRKPSFAIIQ